MRYTNRHFTYLLTYLEIWVKATQGSSWPRSCTRRYGRIPRYLSGDCQLISDASRRLRLGDRSFTVAGLQIWNSLPADLHLVDNYAPLKGIYVWVRLRRLVTLLFLGAVYKYTYLLTFLPFVGYGFLSVFYSNFVPILRYSTCNYTVTYLETRVRGHSRSSKMIPFNPAPMTSY